MTATAATIIRWLDAHESVSSLDFNGIAAVTGIDALVVSQTFGELIAAGLVSRDASRTIHNLATYRLTAAGLDALDEIVAELRARAAAKRAERERRDAEIAANAPEFHGAFCPLCALMGRDRCECNAN